jgi:glycosyltransferase involved in cell wall biosynthesis
MLTNNNILCFANDFKNDPTSKQQVMTLLSKYNKVLWVNSISLRAPKMTTSDCNRIWDKIRRFVRGVERINDNMFVITPLVLPFPSSRLIRFLNNILLKIFLSYYINKLKMKDIQIWTFMPTMVDLLGNLNEKLIVYYCVDEWSEFSFIDKVSIIDMETRLLKKSDIVIVTAQKLYVQKSKYNPNTYLVRHGVDFDFFNKATLASTVIPDDISSIHGPRIGFFGLIHEWVDIELLQYIATNNPKWSIVLIGKVAESIDISSLIKCDNIHFLGQKEYSKLPGYCRGFDVAIIPFVVNALTVNVNPIKLREYLAAGLPVVSSNLPEIVPYKDVVHLAINREDYCRGIQISLTERDTVWVKKRQDSVVKETWLAKVEEISMHIDNLNY